MPGLPTHGLNGKITASKGHLLPETVPQDRLAELLPSLLERHPGFAVLAAVLALALLLKLAVSGRAAPKDPTRMFSQAQRLEGFARAGGICELDGAWFIRCRKPAHHGDHWYPWSKGGATSMTNFVAACVRCNTSKGAKLPGFFATQRIEARRRRYFAAGVPTKAGQKFTQR